MHKVNIWYIKTFAFSVYAYSFAFTYFYFIFVTQVVTKWNKRENTYIFFVEFREKEMKYNAWEKFASESREKSFDKEIYDRFYEWERTTT